MLLLVVLLLPRYSRRLRCCVQLVFHGNPIANSTGVASAYHLEIGRRFPTLVQLDCEHFSALIRFDVPDALRASKVPASEESFISAAHASSIQPFVHRYADMHSPMHPA